MKAPSRTPSALDRPEICAALFSPAAHGKRKTGGPGLDLAIPVSDPDAILGCRLYADSPAHPLIVFFHGGAETTADYDAAGQAYNEVGINILVSTYRGYGWSSGEPSVSTLFRDNLAILEFITANRGGHALDGPIFIMGRSLGSASAIDLAHRCPELLKGLIIDSGFADSLPLAERLDHDLKLTAADQNDCFNNRGKIREISMPTLILHGARDQLVPVAEAETLQAESGARTKQFLVIPGADHNSLLEVAGTRYFDTIKKFIDTVTGSNTWRQRRRAFKKDRGEKS